MTFSTRQARRILRLRRVTLIQTGPLDQSPLPNVSKESFKVEDDVSQASAPRTHHRSHRLYGHHPSARSTLPTTITSFIL